MIDDVIVETKLWYSIAEISLSDFNWCILLIDSLFLLEALFV